MAEWKYQVSFQGMGLSWFVPVFEPALSFETPLRCALRRKLKMLKESMVCMIFSVPNALAFEFEPRNHEIRKSDDGWRCCADTLWVYSRWSGP
jgi:hypothetical protein